MVKLMCPPKRENNGKFTIVAFADSVLDVTSEMTIEGLSSDAKLSYSSVIVTADADVAFLKSDGTWNWI